MSQRREKRLRQLERRVEALSEDARTTKTLGLVLNDNMEGIRERVDSLEIRADFAERTMETRAMDAKRMPSQPKRGILQRIVDFFSGR